jgi:uncharacterized damage-inducible protein DinB
MHRLAIVVLLLAIARLAAAQAPVSSPCGQGREVLSATLRDAYQSAIRNLVQVAELAPGTTYAFTPVPEARSLGAQLAHTTDVMRMQCSLAAGSGSPAGEGVEARWKTKADVLAALQDAQHYCDGVYRMMTDARALEPVSAGPAVPRARLLIDNVSHIRQHIGNVRTYLRLNGVTPPPTERLPVLRKPTGSGDTEGTPTSSDGCPESRAPSS